MDPQAFDLLKEVIEGIKSDVTEIKADVKTLNEFRWKVVGGIIVFNLIFGFAAQILISKFQ